MAVFFVCLIWLTACAAPSPPAKTAADKPAEAVKPVKPALAATQVPKPAAPMLPAPTLQTQANKSEPTKPASDGAGSSVAPPTTNQPQSAQSQSQPNITITPNANLSALPTSAPLPTLIPTVILIEPRVIELEYPIQMRLGDSELIRLALVPSAEGYTVTIENRNNQVLTQTINLKKPIGYDVSALARLEAVGFDINSSQDEPILLLENELAVWRWTIRPHESGNHKLILSVDLLWVSQQGNSVPKRMQLFSRGIEITVMSVIGLPPSQATVLGGLGLAIGVGISAATLVFARNKKSTLIRIKEERNDQTSLQRITPNEDLKIEHQADLVLNQSENRLIKALFHRYDRVLVERQFRSGYSGAKTLLVLPIHKDGRSDAYTIAKISDYATIKNEYDNYQNYVKDTLPPITARIQDIPITINSKLKNQASAVLRYTFIGEPGKTPISLRETLLKQPNPELFNTLFKTFGPSWWMQRHPYAFKLAQEYDRVLPAHFVAQPTTERTYKTVDGATCDHLTTMYVGEIVKLRNFVNVEPSGSEGRFTLISASKAGAPPLRIRCIDWEYPPNLATSSTGVFAKIISTRHHLLKLAVGESEEAISNHYFLPNPIHELPFFLNEHISGTRSTIHGDLNLENVLIGPGNILWLIDFATTREGHTLFDFAHLHAEILAHVIAKKIDTVERFIEPKPEDLPYLELCTTIDNIARSCLFNPAQRREYDLAVYMACLGALKHSNLNSHQRQLLYVESARLCQSIRASE